MAHFKAAHATAEDWAHVAQACVDKLAPLPEGANLGFVYVTDVLANDFSSILMYLRQKTGVEHWVGTVGLGICASNAEYFDMPALAVMVATLPPEGFRVFPALSREGAHLPDDSRAWAAKGGAPFAIVHADPTNAHTPALIDTVAEDTTGFLVGGLTSSRGPCHQVAGRITGGGVSGVLFSPEVEVATGLTQGCAPLAGAHIITDGLDKVIISLDGRRALDVFKEDIGELLARDLNRAAGYVHAAFPIEGSDLNDYLVRNIIGIDMARGWIAVGGDVQAGHRVMFVRRDPKTAETDLVRMVDTLKRRLPGPPKGGVYFSCVARGANMFGREGREMELIRERLGDFPLVGFYAGGEISNCRLYGYTGVLAVFL
jgi:small ligand-binding sensory domain FIST